MKSSKVVNVQCKKLYFMQVELWAMGSVISRKSFFAMIFHALYLCLQTHFNENNHIQYGSSSPTIQVWIHASNVGHHHKGNFWTWRTKSSHAFWKSLEKLILMLEENIVCHIFYCKCLWVSNKVNQKCFNLVL